MPKHIKKTDFTYNHARRLFRIAQKTPEELFQTLKSSYKGLSEAEVAARLKLFGPNNSQAIREASALYLIFKAIKNPIIYLILSLALISFLAGNIQASIFMLVIIFISVTLTFLQENRFNKVVQRLLSMTQTHVTVIRNYPYSNKKTMQPPSFNHVVPVTQLVPGDIIRVSPGDIIPADIRLLSTKDLLLNQSVLTGETIPIDKDSEFDDAFLKSLPDLKNICFLGSCVVSGTGIGIVVHTGREAYVSSIANLQKSKNRTSFDSGIQNFVLSFLKLILIMTPLIFLIYYFSRGNLIESLLFAITIAVSLTPKSLPLTISGNLTRAALTMMKKRVIVKRLSAMQNLGAMDVLCTDKTGTLTEELSVCEGGFNPYNRPDKKVLLYSFLNSYFLTGHKNHLDFALIKYGEKMDFLSEITSYTYIDELPFDASRKRTSILVKNIDGSSVLICKGAIEEILPLCNSVQEDSTFTKLEDEKKISYISMTQRINELGLQAIAVSYKIFPELITNCHMSDENDLTLLGYVTFLDPPVKKDIHELLQTLNIYGVGVKILTGDNHWDAIKVAKEMGVKSEKILLGTQIDLLSDKDLEVAVEKTSIFAKLSPEHKQRIIYALQACDHTVGYLGDGINDVPALFVSDVGISVNNAVSTAKESSDIILLEKSLSGLTQGIIEGRKAFYIINKYIKLSSITKFSSVLSMLGACTFLPFLPMKPVQMLVQNLIFGLSQSGIPLDNIDEEHLKKPSKWEFSEIQKLRFSFAPILTFFDYSLFAIMWFYFQTKTSSSQGVFQSAWLIESIIVQALVVHLLHSQKIPFIHIKKPKPSLIVGFLAICLGIYFPFSPFANLVGFTSLPKEYFVFIILILIAYCLAMKVMKVWFCRKFKMKSIL